MHYLMHYLKLFYLLEAVVLVETRVCHYVLTRLTPATTVSKKSLSTLDIHSS